MFIAPPGPLVVRTNLTIQVYDVLRDALLEGRLRPHQRLRIRDLANALDVSETPVREAVMQLVRERALMLQTARSLTVPRLSLPTYLELRQIRLKLEGFAAREAATRFDAFELARLEAIDTKLVASTAARDWPCSVGLNWHFHAGVYQVAGMPELFNLIQGLWLRTGPLLSLCYPIAPPRYNGRRRHLDILDAIRAADGHAMCEAIQQDMLEGSADLLPLLADLDAGKADDAPHYLPALDLADVLRPR